MYCEDVLRQVAVCTDDAKRADLVGEVFFANMGLTITFMNEMCKSKKLHEDFLQVAYIAMYKASMSYREDSGYSVLSYYRMCLRHESYQLWLKSGFSLDNQEVAIDTNSDESVRYNKVYKFTDRVEQEFMNKFLWERINVILSDRNSLVLTQRFKMNRTLSSIGRELGISAERVRQLIQKSCNTLKEDVLIQEVARYYYYA